MHPVPCSGHGDQLSAGEGLLQEGSITADEVRRHPMRNFVEYCIGGETELPEMSLSGQQRLQPGDVLLAISTSGNSANILKAIQTAKAIGLVVIGLTGRSGGKMKDMCDICLCAPSDSTPRIQECHLFFEHTLCACIEESLFGELRK